MDHQPTLTKEETRMRRRAAIKKARGYIEREDILCLDLCAETSQAFGNVRHMWNFIVAVAVELDPEAFDLQPRVS